MRKSSWLDTCLNACLPTRCLLCAGAGGRVPNLCDECSGALPRLRPRDGSTCRQCAADIRGGTLCARCLSVPPPFTRLRAPFRYQSGVDTLVRAAKFHGRRDAARSMARLLEEALLLDPLPDAAVIVPMPLHPRRRAERGFDQNQRVLGLLARRHRLSVAAGALHRSRHGSAQSVAESVAERWSNVAGAFTVPPNRRLSGQHLVLFDDVVTSGATARAAAAALRSAGARTVEILAFARTPDTRTAVLADNASAPITRRPPDDP